MNANLKEIENSVVGDIWNSSESTKNIIDLCNIGSMFNINEGELEGRDFILNKFEDYGLDDVHAEAIKYNGWIRGKDFIQILEPVNEEIKVWSGVYCPSTPSEGIVGKLIYIGEGSYSDFEKKKGEISGNIVMVTSESEKGGAAVHRREKYGRAVQYGATAFIYVNHFPGLLYRAGSLRTNMEAEIPGVGINYESGWKLIQHMKQGPVKLKIFTKHTMKPLNCHHVMGDIKGTEYPDEIIVVGAHYDSHDISPGALDNKNGVVGVLEVARVLAKYKKYVKRTLRFWCFPVEEHGVTGSTIYTIHNKEKLKKVNLMLNLHHLDVPGKKIFSVVGFPDLVPYLTKLTESINYPTKVRLTMQHNSDSFAFVMNGVQSFSITGSQYPTKFALTNADTIDKVNFLGIKEGSMVAAKTALKICNENKRVADHKTSEQVKEMLKMYGMDKRLKVTRQWEIFFPNE